MEVGQVVVVTLEEVARDAEPLGKGVEFVVRHVADHVAPPPAAQQPQRVVDENHAAMLPALEQVAAWRRGRSEVLSSLLALPRLFTTQPMQDQEPRARANLEFELASLG